MKREELWNAYRIFVRTVFAKTDYFKTSVFWGIRL
jgi:hypothetical protein